jgi:hypothetical protein
MIPGRTGLSIYWNQTLLFGVTEWGTIPTRTINVISGRASIANFGEHQWSMPGIEWDTIPAGPVNVIALRTGFPDLWNALCG